jgi:DNA-binding FrmR family transcriptional regulator
MSEVEISVTDGSITSPAPQGASGGLEAIGARASTPRTDPEGRGGLDRYATKHDILHLEYVIARFGSGVVSELRRLETSLNSTSAVLDGRISSVDGRISSLEKIVDAKFTASDGKIDGLEKRMDGKFAAINVTLAAINGKIDGLAKSLDDHMAHLKELRVADSKVYQSDLKAIQNDLKSTRNILYFSIAISAVVVGVVLSVAFRM